MHIVVAMSYALADRVFKTKKDIKQECRALWASTTPGTLITEAWLVSLLDHHDEADEKKKDMTGITTAKDAYGNISFCVVRHDGGVTHFSTAHIIDRCLGRSNKQAIVRSNFTMAFRHAIKPQIDAFRAGRSGDVDHLAPWTFANILSQWTRITPYNSSDFELIAANADGTGNAFSPSPAVRDWQSFHERHARLELVSREEHHARAGHRTRMSWKDWL